MQTDTFRDYISLKAYRDAKSTSQVVVPGPAQPSLENQEKREKSVYLVILQHFPQQCALRRVEKKHPVVMSRRAPIPLPAKCKHPVVHSLIPPCNCPPLNMQKVQQSVDVGRKLRLRAEQEAANRGLII